MQRKCPFLFFLRTVVSQSASRRVCVSTRRRSASTTATAESCSTCFVSLRPQERPPDDFGTTGGIRPRRDHYPSRYAATVRDGFPDEHALEIPGHAHALLDSAALRSAPSRPWTGQVGLHPLNAARPATRQDPGLH